MRVLGHPLHPILVHFPVVFWTLATVFDALSGLGFSEFWRYAGFSMVAGLIAAAVAMLGGLIDLKAIPQAAMPDANRHLYLMSTAFTLYLVSLFLRIEDGSFSQLPQIVSIIFSCAGFAMMMLGAWYGGQLVYHHGAGVRPRDRETDL